MSTLRILLGCSTPLGLTARRLSKLNCLKFNHYSANYGLEKLRRNQFRNINLRPMVASIHQSSSNLNERRIDESLNRLDMEIRKVGRIRRQEVDDILEDIKTMKKATSSQSLMIIRCCGEMIPEESPTNRTHLVQQIWKTLEKLNVPMDVSHYNALLRVYLENEHKFNPTEFLQNLTSKGIEPNRVTYQRLIARFCQDGDIDGASTILQYMKDKQMPINEYVFNALIIGHAQANDMESAEGILGVMKQAGLEPNDDTYVALMTGYAKHGDTKNIHRIVKECEEKEIFLIDRDFLFVIYKLAENNHTELVDEILPYLKRKTGFNQEITNLIFKLSNINQEETAYKMLKQMMPVVRQENPLPSGNFFVKHLVQTSKPAELIVKYCNALKADGLHEYALSRACDNALNEKKFELATTLIEALQSQGFPIRQHYFWPLFASATSESEVYQGIKHMRDLRQTPSIETLREYIIPNILQNQRDAAKMEKSLQKLASFTGMQLGTLVSAAMLHLLSQSQIKVAADFASSYRLNSAWQQLRRAIAEAYIKTNDVASLVKIIGSLGYESGDDGSRENIGTILLELVECIRTGEKKVALLLPVLEALHANGFGISNSGSEFLLNNLGEALTPELTNAIMQLTSADLTPKFSDDYKRSGGPQQLEEKTTEELEQQLAVLTSKGVSTKGVKKALLYNYCRDKNVEKAQAIKDDLAKEDFVLTAGLRTMLLDLYVSAGDLDNARLEYNELTKQLDFKMDDLKILRYAALLQSTGDFEGCIDVLRNAPRDETRKPTGAAQQATVWKLLNATAESSQAAVAKVFEVLAERKLTPINNVTLGPLIKAHLIKEDLNGALQEFERCVNQYKATPWKQELFCQFIKLEDADKLQKVMDLSTMIHGEVNSMYDLVFAFIDCGKVRQAKRILETPGLRARNDKFEMFCQRYNQDNRVAEIENLLQVTKDLMDVDRSSMYFYLLQSYCKLGDPDKALSVWTSMQEENLQPSIEFLVYLADFLRKNDRPVPFVVPGASEVSRNKGSEGQSSSSVKLPNSIEEIRKCIELNDIDKALQLKQRMEAEGASLSLTDTSNLIAGLARAERLNEASRLTDKLLEQGLHPLPRTLRFLTGRLASAGEVSILQNLENHLSLSMKRMVMINSRLCTAYTVSNRGPEYFENFIKKIVEAGPNEVSQNSDEDTPNDGDNVPVSGMTKLLLQNEELVAEFEKLVTIAKGTHQRAVNNALWAFFMCKKDFARAEEIWNAHLKKESRVLFRSVVLHARGKSDLEVSKALVAQVSTSEHISGPGKAIAVSCALDLLGDAGQFEEAVELVKGSLKHIQLTDYPPSVLKRLKEKAELNNKSFPFVIPARERRSRKVDSSDSDSD